MTQMTTATETQMTVEQARSVYAMGLVPALAAGLDIHGAVEVIIASKSAGLDERGAANIGKLWIGKTVNDGKLGSIVEFDGLRVKLHGYLNNIRWAHVGELSDWSFRA